MEVVTFSCGVGDFVKLPSLLEPLRVSLGGCFLPAAYGLPVNIGCRVSNSASKRRKKRNMTALQQHCRAQGNIMLAFAPHEGMEMVCGTSTHLLKRLPTVVLVRCPMWL